MNRSIFLVIVFGLIFSCEDIIEVEDISNQRVVILAPTNNSVLTQNDVTFSWNSLEEASGYHLQIATPNFENATQIVIDSLVTTTNLLNTLSAGDYQWRVRAQNSEYETSYTTQSFSVE